MNQHEAWTEAMERLLRDLWAEDLSAREIGEKITAKTGQFVNRAAVIGKAHRMDLPRRAQANKGNTKTGNWAVGDSKPIFASDTSGPVVKACQWPIGHPGDDKFHFCGKQAVPFKPYCKAHCAVAYQKRVFKEENHAD